MPNSTLIRIVDWDKLYESASTKIIKNMKFVPVPNKMDGSGYTELLDHPDGACHFAAWIAMLQIASRCKVRGVLCKEDANHDAKSLSRISRIPEAVFVDAIKRLLVIGWISIGADEVEVVGKKNDQNPDREPTLAEKQDTWFVDEFWPVYWRKTGKAEGLRCFRRQATCESVKDRIVAAVREQSTLYLQREEEYRPHASTWLNQRRFEDKVGSVPATSAPPRKSKLEEMMSNL